MKAMIKRVVFDEMDALYRTKNRRRPRVLMYTDSRGYNLSSHIGKTGYGTYAQRLRSKYALTYRICPEKYTTILDFLNFIEAVNIDSYAAVVMHCGIVDFSPRPLSGIAKLKESKQGLSSFSDLFSSNREYYANPFACDYYGEPTINIYSPKYLEDALLPRLAAIRKLIWISSNGFVPGWDGNYVRGRPANISEVVGRFDDVMAGGIRHTVDLRAWSPEMIKEFTIDNIHYTRIGFKKLGDLIINTIDAVLDQAARARDSAPGAFASAP
jgi:hypothetical protein